MLLRRFLTHFRAQDWLAIVLDFVIVVVGIFVGLQVDSWNQERKERTREQASLQQLYTDFERAEEQARSSVEFHNDKAAELQFAIDKIVAGSLTDAERDRFQFAVISMLQLPPLGVTMGTYESMVATGDLGLIRDDRLKSMLIDLDAQIDAETSYLDYFRSQNALDFDYSKKYFPLVPNADRTDIVFLFDFDAISSDRETLGMLATHQRTHRLFSRIRLAVADSIAGAQTHIGEMIGDSDVR
jgi:hypothetical protein